MPSIVVPVDALALGPGYLFWAPIATALPANTVVGGVFTDDWPAAWLAIGATEEGHVFNHQLNVDPVEVAEYLNAIAQEPTGVEETLEFAMAQISATNWKRAMNGGTITTTGTGATTMTTFAPPKLDQITRAMIGWESRDNTERLVAHQVLNTGQVSTQRRKGAQKATLPVSYTLEQPADGSDPWTYFTAGTKRV